MANNCTRISIYYVFFLVSYVYTISSAQILDSLLNSRNELIQTMYKSLQGSVSIDHITVDFSNFSNDFVISRFLLSAFEMIIGIS
jgi:hypothetical protein